MNKKWFLVPLLWGSIAAHCAENFFIHKIRFEGLQRVSEGAALQYLPVGEGELVSDQTAGSIIRSLFASGNFEQVEVYNLDSTMLIKVRERPTISAVTLSGNKKVSKKDLEDKLKILGVHAGEPLDCSRLSSLEKGLEEHYGSQGYYNARVNAVVTRLARNRAELKLSFTEGVAAKVEQINIVGNHAFPTEQLRKLFSLRDDLQWWNFFARIRKGDEYHAYKLGSDLENLQKFYTERGYARFSIGKPQVNLTPNKKGVYITMYLDEGEAYTLDEISLVGDLAGHGRELNKLNDLLPGSQYNATKIELLVDKIESTLGDYGYCFPEVEPVQEFDDVKHKVKLKIKVEPGRRFYVHRIEFAGNQHTEDKVLRREMRQMEGAWLNKSLVMRGKRRLERTGYFSTVGEKIREITSPGVEEGSQEEISDLSDDSPISLKQRSMPFKTTGEEHSTSNQVDVIYEVLERHRGSIRASINYELRNKMGFGLGFDQDNVLGTGKRMGIDFNKSRSTASLSLSFNEPYFTINEVGFGGSAYYSNFKAEKVGLSRYTEKKYGLKGTLDFPINENNSLYASIGYKYSRLGDLEAQLAYEDYLKSIGVSYGVEDPKALDKKGKDEKGKDNKKDVPFKLISFEGRDFPLTFGWRFNSFDRGFFPTSGAFRELELGWTQIASRNAFYKISFDGVHYWPINADKKWIIRGAFGFGYADGLAGKKLPFFESFHAGEVRGLVENIGPRALYLTERTGGRNRYKLSEDGIGGNAKMTASIDLIFPTPYLSEKHSDTVRTSLFVDAGNVWDTHWKSRVRRLTSDQIIRGKQGIPDYGSFRQIRISAGVALNWISPIGPMAFTLAYPLKKYPGDRVQVFDLTIAKEF